MKTFIHFAFKPNRFKHARCSRHVAGLLLTLLAAMTMHVSTAWPQGSRQSGNQETRCLALELHVTNSQQNEIAGELVREALQGRAGITLRVFNHADGEGVERHRQICDHFELPADTFPLLYGCGQTVVVPDEMESLQRELDALLTMTVFIRTGCPHCASGKEFLRQIAATYPGLMIQYRDLVNDSAASRDVQTLVDRYNKRAVSVPVFHFCNQLIVGFDRADTTGRQIQRVLESWSFPCPEASTSLAEPPDKSATEERESRPESVAFRPAVSARTPFRRNTANSLAPASRCVAKGVSKAVSRQPIEHDVDVQGEDDQGDRGEDLLPLPPLPAQDEIPLPPLGFEENGPASESDKQLESDVVELPFFGNVSAEAVGLPLFTIAVGLVDGFNPCAMWVLLFLLSILVNLKDRWKILAVAGTFVVVSGLAYFAFMAAWLSVFQFIGLLRPAQITLGLLAMVIGAVHVKDFFAFKRGITFSIPESAKPTVYARVRGIVNAESLWAAIIGAATLAVLVNIIELLCTAGLPAMYTGILTMRQLSAWQEYGYLALYNVAYMFDDSLMVAIVVITLGRHKLQEREGRWLKLVSGAVIFGMGLVMLVRPEWLV